MESNLSAYLALFGIFIAITMLNITQYRRRSHMTKEQRREEDRQIEIETHPYSL